jgi:tetratricopeptide (TPR) repeat protein
MPHSSIRRRLTRLLAAASLLLWLSGIALGQVGVRGPGRFVDIVEVSEHDDQIDITAQFNCSVRYVTHLPASEGTELRVQLQPLPDCGVAPGVPVASELPPLSGGAGVLTAVRVDSDVPGQITLVFDFKKSEQFVLAQGVDPRGLRVRIIRPVSRRGQILLTQPTDSVSNFAINLESQPRPFDAEALDRAHQLLQAPVFVSEVVLEGQKWYRLRIGPIDRRAEADRLLEKALPEYPRAWLAIGDDAVTSDPNATAAAALPPVERMGSDPPLDAATLKTLLGQVKSAMATHDYATAIRILTKLQRQPEFPERAHAQELLGLARERSGQLAHAKAEYEEYLRRYPKGEAAERVALRLRILRAATETTQAGGQPGRSEGRWQLTGGVAQLFRYDGTRVDNTTGSVPPGTTITPGTTQSTSENELFNNVDVLARRRGDQVDWMGRLSAGYAKSFASQNSFGTQNQTQVSIASVEFVDRSLGLLGRFGRQTRNQDGVLGTFDGLFVSYQWRPAWGINFTAGYPVEQTYASVHTDRRFEAVALAYSPPGAHWDASIFAALEQFDGIKDRQATGFEARYLASHASLVLVVDYDTFYHALNTASLLGTVQLPWRWNVSFDAERRNSPVLTTRNALIGQPATSLAQLEQQGFDAQTLFQWARDRTPYTTDYSVTATRPLGQRLQFSATVGASQTSATPGSGGVDAQPATGLELIYQAQLYGSSLWRPGDFSVASISYANTETGKVDTLSASSRFPLVGAWRLGPRLTIDRRVLASDGSTELTYIPSALLDYQRGLKLLQFEIGGELGKRAALLETQNTKRYYVSLSYRIGF